MTDLGWDGRRLDDAFKARSATATTPTALADEVIRHLDQARPDRTGSRRGWLAAAAGVVVVVGLGAVLAGRPGPPAPPAAGSASPGPPSALNVSPSPGHSAQLTLLDSPIAVGEAVLVRDRGVDDRELVVTGVLAGYSGMSCPLDLRPPNPTRLGCPAAFTWLLDSPEELMTRSSDGVTGHPPTGPSIQPSFDLVELPQGARDDSRFTLVGHFDDRRAALCEPDERERCQATFVVDRVAAVDGVEQPVSTTLRTDRSDTFTPSTVRDLVEDVDRLVLGVAPRAVIASRQVVEIDRVIPLEPVLADDEFVPYIGNPATLVWLVTAIDPGRDHPIARTFALFDGSNWFAEVTSEGARMLERRASPVPSDGPLPPAPTDDPAAFDNAPTSVLGIKVRSIDTVMRDRKASMDDLGRDELAVRGWYVASNPAATCEPSAPIHPPTPPCDSGRHWLLDLPEQLATATGQVRTNPEHWPPVLNPLVPIDVPFDVAATWDGPNPIPRPVVVLGHFLDHRVDTYAGSVYFVVDALVWTRDRSVGTLDTLTRLTSSAAEDPASVLARVGDASSRDAVATWTTVVDAAAFSSMEPELAVDAPEFTSGPPVWIVRRLIRDAMDGRDRLAIEWAYTTDGGARVWRTETPDSPTDLATSIDVGPFGDHTRSVKVYDYGQWIVSVRRASAADNLNWQPTNPKRDGIVEVARGADGSRGRNSLERRRLRSGLAGSGEGRVESRR